MTREQRRFYLITAISIVLLLAALWNANELYR